MLGNIRRTSPVVKLYCKLKEYRRLNGEFPAMLYVQCVHISKSTKSQQYSTVIYCQVY